MRTMELSARDLSRFQRFAEDTARLAGELLKKRFHAAHRVRYKGRIDPVTEADVKSERLITARLRRAFPGHALLAEEGSGTGAAAEFQWVVDPLDGTVNYAHGFPIYCVSIALQFRGLPAAGAVYDPERDEMFRGARGQGAYCNRTRLRVAREIDLQRALLATGFGYNVATARRNNLGYFARMVKRAQGVRRPGSAAIDLCWLAAGRIDGFWELDLHPWDTAAAVLFIEEAGGKVTRTDGRPFAITDRSILAANPRLHASMLKVLSGR